MNFIKEMVCDLSLYFDVKPRRICFLESNLNYSPLFLDKEEMENESMGGSVMASAVITSLLILYRE